MCKRFFFSVMAGLVTTVAFGQEWLQNPVATENKGGSPNFYQIQDQFNTFFESHNRGKGTGYKQFLRYVEFMKPRVYPSGNFPEDALWKATVEKEANRLKSGTSNASDWKPIGPVLVPTFSDGTSPGGSGRVNCIAFHPTDQNIIYVGAPSGGIWKTTDGGTTWTTQTDQLPALGISDIAINPKNPSIIYAVTGDKDGGNTCPTYSYGILVSTDAGATWQATGMEHQTSSQYRMRRLVINSTNPDILIAAGGPGLFRSTDAGVTWTQIQTGDFFDIELKPDNSAIVYACTGNSIYKSTDSGASFSKIEQGLPTSGIGRIEMAVTKANANVVYAVMSNSASGFKGLYKSSDAGTTWAAQSTEATINPFSYEIDGSGNTGIAWYAICLAVDQQNENIVYTGSVNHWISSNGGVTWSLMAHWYGGGGKPYVHADIHTMAVNPLNNIAYSGNDGGIYKTADKGVTWVDISAGLSILQIYRMGVSVTNPDLIIEGAQDNGTYLYNSGQWNRVYGGDGMDCAIDPVLPSIMYCTTQNGGLQKSMNSGQSWTSIKPEESGSWITPFQISPINHNMLVAGYTYVYLSSNYGRTWEKISDDLTGGNDLNEITFAPSDDRYIYTSYSANLWGTRNRGESWEKLNNGLPNLSIENITVAASEPEKVWVTFSGYTAGEKIYYSQDGGSSWTNYSQGLPNVPVNGMTVNKLSHYTLYAGTDLGVYYRTPDMDQWLPFDKGLPNVIVNELDINYKLGKIRAATFGRGVWESPINSDGNWPPALQLNAYEQATQIDLSWIVPTDRVPDHYAIYRNNVQVATSQSNTYSDPVTNGMCYTYQVTAIYPDGESTPTNKVVARGIVTVTIPYNQNFETQAHGWLLDEQPASWQWGTGSTLKLTQLGTGNFIGINSVVANENGKHAQGYALLPKMDLSNQSKLILSAKYALRRWLDYDHLYLKYRTSGDPSWKTLTELATTGKQWAWRTFTYNMPDSLMTDELELAFYYTDNGNIGYGAALDDVVIAKEMSGIDDPMALQGVSLYPNPAGNTITLDFKGFTGQMVRTEIIDVNGQVVLKKELGSVISGTQKGITVSNLSPGNYFVKVYSGDQIWINSVTKK